MYNNALYIHNELLNDYELEYADFSDDKKMKKYDKYFLKDTTTTTGLIFKRMKNQMIKH